MDAGAGQAKETPVRLCRWSAGLRSLEPGPVVGDRGCAPCPPSEGLAALGPRVFTLGRFKGFRHAHWSVHTASS